MVAMPKNFPRPLVTSGGGDASQRTSAGAGGGRAILHARPSLRLSLCGRTRGVGKLLRVSEAAALAAAVSLLNTFGRRARIAHTDVLQVARGLDRRGAGSRFCNRAAAFCNRAASAIAGGSA